MFKETMMPGDQKEEGKDNKPEFVPKPGLMEEQLQKKELEKKKMIEESGFNEEECSELMSVCQDAFGNEFSFQEIGGTKVNRAELDIKKIEKISETEVKVVGTGFSPKLASGNWEMKVVKDGNAWRVEKAVEV
jgi:hypothetical protein